MQRNTKVVCPVCERLVTLDGTTNGRGELILPRHIRALWKRCEGSYRPLNVSRRPDGCEKHSDVRGEV